MKIFKITFIFFLLTIKLYAINDINNLKETVNSFGNSYLQDSAKLPVEFLLTYEEFKIFYENAAYSQDLREGNLPAKYDEHVKRINFRYQYFRKEFNNSYNIKSFDSFLFTQENNSLITIRINYFGKSNYFNANDDLGALFDFVICKGKIKLIGSCRRTDNFEFRSKQLNRIQQERYNQFTKTYKGNYFEYSFYNAIPIKEKDKWGLISLEGKQILRPRYDSIYPFRSDFALVANKNNYNLLSKDFKEVFNKEYKKIKYERGQYYLLNANNKFVKYPFRSDTDEELIFLKADTIIAVQADEIKQENNSIKPIYEYSYLQKLNDDYYSHSKFSIQNKYGNSFKERVSYVIDNKSKDTIASLKSFLFLDMHNDFMFGYKNDTSFVLKPNGNIVFKSNFICNYTSPGYTEIFDKTTSLFGFYSPYTNVYIKPIYKIILPIDRDKFFVVITKNGMFGYLNQDGKELF